MILTGIGCDSHWARFRLSLGANWVPIGSHGVRAELSIEGDAGHGEGVEITDLTFSNGGNLFSSRGMEDGVVQLWDKRKLSGGRGAGGNKPVLTLRDVGTNHANSNCGFSPSDDVLAVATGGNSGGSGAMVTFYDLKKAGGKGKQPKAGSIGVGEGNEEESNNSSRAATATQIAWNVNINQIAVGTSQGKTDVLYDPGE